MRSPDDVRSLEVILTAGCNLRCSYCYQTDKKARSMSWDTLRASLDLLLRSRHDEIDLLFIGGEPLLEFPLIRQAVAYVAEKRRPELRVQYDIITNGTLLGDEHVRFFVAHDFDVQLSFDGVPEAQALRAKGTYAVLDRLLDHLREEHPAFFRDRLRVSLTLLPRTIPWFADSIAYFLNKGIQTILIAPGITHQPDWSVERIDELDAAFDRISRLCVNHFEDTGDLPLAVLRRSGGPQVRRASAVTMCGVTSGDNVAVDVDGQVLGCVTFAPSYQVFPTPFLRNRLEALRMGGVEEPGLAARRAQYPAAARAAGLFTDKQEKYSSYGRCRDCRYLNTCSICPVSIGHQPGNTDPHRIPDFLCAYNLVSQKYREQFPVVCAPDVLSRVAQIYDLLRDINRRLPGGVGFQEREGMQSR